MASQFNNQKPKLKYLFVAFFEDGHVIAQTPEDVSTIDPEKRSAFFDVLEYEKKSRIVSFKLYKLATLIDNKYESVEVNLKDGNFAINEATIVNIADQNFIPQAPFRLVYFRETRLETDVKKQQDKPDEVVDQRFYVNRYFIGWQTMWNGKNYQRTIAIS